MKNICKIKIFSGLKDTNFIGLRSTSSFQKSKKYYLWKYFQYNFQTSGSTWKKNQLLHKKPNKNDDIVIRENGAIICTQKVVSYKFNNYFTHVSQNSLRELGEPNQSFKTI